MLVLTRQEVCDCVVKIVYSVLNKKEGLNALKTVLPDITQFAVVTTEQFEQYKDAIKNETTRKWIKHVVYECDRVRKSAEAMKNNNIALFGQYMNGSHDSLQYDYEVTYPELDYVVNMGRKIDGVLGVRMTGAGGREILWV